MLHNNNNTKQMERETGCYAIYWHTLKRSVALTFSTQTNQMSFDINDPLGDLSDGSEDSFFDDPKLSTKRASLTKTPDKKALLELFNVTDDKPKTESKPSEKLPTQKPYKKITFDDNDDILASLTIKDKPEVTIQKKTSLFEDDDILEGLLPKKKTDLGESETKKVVEKKTISFSDILNESKVEHRPTTKSDLQGFALSSGDVPKEGRRGRRESPSGISDPLGLFIKDQGSMETKSKEVESSVTDSLGPNQFSKSKTQSRSTPNITEPDLPDWLGGKPMKKHSSDGTISRHATTSSDSILKHDYEPSKTAKSTTELSTGTLNTTIVQESINLPKSNSYDDNPTLSTVLKQQKLSQAEIENQNTFLTLQQQESQLLLALQLKKYEENLQAIQQQQQQVLHKQEKQFDELLTRYFSRQTVVENNIKLQQERISNHLQMLLLQQPAQYKSEEDKVMEAGLVEKVQFQETLVETLKQRHNEEMFLMEESYKKQITLLEQQMEVTENRLKTELDSIAEIFQDKMKEIRLEHDQDIQMYKERIAKLNEEHANDIKMIRENCGRIIDELKFEHSSQIENMRKIKENEQNLMSDSKEFGQKLDDSVNLLDLNSKALISLQSKITGDYTILSVARENSLAAKEKEIEMMREALETCRQKAETERAQLMSLIRGLELKLAQQNQEAREDRWALQQAAATISARSSAMDREMDFHKASIERDREQLKTLKESLLAEQERAILQLTEEKLSLAAEKSRIEISNKLTNNFEVEKSKAEAETLIQIAREAAAQSDKERESLHRQQLELERLKRQLIDRESELSIKQRELDEALYNAERKSKEGEIAVKESQKLETKYNSRLQELKIQLSTLSSREKKLAEDKLMLSREKLSMYAMARQVRKCGLCAVDIKGEGEEMDFPPPVNFEPDPDMLRFRKELEEERNSEVSREES